MKQLITYDWTTCRTREGWKYGKGLFVQSRRLERFLDKVTER